MEDEGRKDRGKQSRQERRINYRKLVKEELGSIIIVTGHKTVRELREKNRE